MGGGWPVAHWPPAPARWAVCDEWQNDDIKAQDADQQRKELKKEWEAIPEAERPTWEQFKRGLKIKK